MWKRENTELIHAFIDTRVEVAMAVAGEGVATVAMNLTVDFYAGADPQARCYCCNTHLFSLVR